MIVSLPVEENVDAVIILGCLGLYQLDVLEAVSPPTLAPRLLLVDEGRVQGLQLVHHLATVHVNTETRLRHVSVAFCKVVSIPSEVWCGNELLKSNNCLHRNVLNSENI